MRNLISLILLSAVTLLFLPAMPVLAQQRAAPAPAKREKPENMMSPQEKELKRISELMAWMRKEHPKQKEFQERLYEPVIKGCREDYPRNLKMAEFYDDKASQAERSNTKTAELYAKAAKYYHALAQQNVNIVKSFGEGKGEDFEKAVATIRQLEGWIQQVTGKTVERNWFLPGELAQATPPVPAAGAKPRVNPGVVR